MLRLWALLNLAPLNPTLSVNRGIQGQLVVLLATQPGARMLPGEMLLAERGEGGKEQGHAKKAYVFYMETLSGGRQTSKVCLTSCFCPTCVMALVPTELLVTGTPVNLSRMKSSLAWREKNLHTGRSADCACSAGKWGMCLEKEQQGK